MVSRHSPQLDSASADGNFREIAGCEREPEIVRAQFHSQHRFESSNRSKRDDFTRRRLKLVDRECRFPARGEFESDGAHLALRRAFFFPFLVQLAGARGNRPGSTVETGGHFEGEILRRGAFGVQAKVDLQPIRMRTGTSLLIAGGVQSPDGEAAGNDFEYRATGGRRRDAKCEEHAKRNRSLHQPSPFSRSSCTLPPCIWSGWSPRSGRTRRRAHALRLRRPSVSGKSYCQRWK